MRVILVGAGGREAALAWRIAQSPSLSQLIVTGENPRWPDGALVSKCSSPDEIVALAGQMAADLVVVGPEAPLEQGLANLLEKDGVPCFGPLQSAALLETSKAFAKEMMDECGVPTAGYLRVDRGEPDSVLAARARCDQGSVAIKVDGLAAGKGVFVCETPEEAHAALDAAWSGRFGEAARYLLLEDRLVGPEVSVFALCDGERVVALPSAQDHKRLLDNDEGPNTGGMGAYVPCPLVSADEARKIVQEVHLPVVQHMARRGTPYRGVLYAGLMITKDGPRVLEFNVRFGDPECQPLMGLWQDDILPWLHGAAIGKLPEGTPEFASGAACCVVMASAKYPASSTKGVAIPEPADLGVEVFVAGAQRDAEGVLRTTGGRVLGVTAMGANISEARAKAYAAVEELKFEGAQFRQDIAAL
ncbi:MAG: phosphoribosylamine--glycine ligase [Proteobacteria bacterium]|nr:phosphoribosylamine--glycine ligase [Pseudomonadota bacterium]